MSDANLPPEVQAVLDAVEGWMNKEAPFQDRAIECAWRAYEASRAPKERYEAEGSGAIRDTYYNVSIRVFYNETERDRILHLLNAAEHGDLFTRTQVEERERAADRKAREECALIADRHRGGSTVIVDAIRASQP